MQKTRVCVAGLIGLGAVLIVNAASAETVIGTSDHPEHGKYLTDGSGMALYLFEEDRRGGDRGRAVESDCLDECLTRWPPVTANPPLVAEGSADAALLGSFTRPDGKVQATYNGWPLYTFAEDFVPGDINGHDFEEFGGEWYLLTPEGGALGEPDEH